MGEKPDIKKIALGLIIGSVVLGGVVYAGYLYTQKYGVNLTLPRGQTYLGKGSGFEELINPPTAPQRFTAGPDVQWIELKGRIYNYSLNYPETLILSIFPGDPSDSVAISWGNIPPERNIFLNVENIPDRDPAYIGKVEEYARNWWQFFSGLTGIRSLEKITTTSGLTGYKAIYINTADQSPNVDIFFAIPGDPNKVIHIANGVLDTVIFNRIIDSLRWEPKTESQSEVIPAD